MWIKLLVGVLLVAASAGGGYLAAEKYRLRAAYFAAWSDFNARYLNELAYTRTPLGELIKAHAEGGEFAKTLAAFSERKALPRTAYLTPEEEEKRGEYFSMLGRSDASSQLAFFRAREPQLEQAREESAKDAKAKSELAAKLGLLAGLAVLIFLL